MPTKNTRPALARILLLVVLGTIFTGQSSVAADWYTGAKTTEPDYASTIVLDASGSVTSTESAFGAAAVTAAVGGNLQQSGVRARVDGIIGEYSYKTTLAPVAPATIGVQQRIQAHQGGGGALVGYSWVSQDWTASLYAGAEMLNTTLNHNDPNNHTQGTSVGARIAGDFYGMLTPSVMVFGYGSYSTNVNTFYTRFKTGYAVWNGVYIGPELSALGNSFYSEYRAGLHMTGLKLGQLSLGISGGFATSKLNGNGVYGLLDARIGF